MRVTPIITSFIRNNEKILLLKRSNAVRTMQGLWAGVSGKIEKNEDPLERALKEIYEEIGLENNEIKLILRGEPMLVSSPQYKNHLWNVHPFLFETDKNIIVLNWENTDYKWISPDEILEFQTVPSLEKILFNLL